MIFPLNLIVFSASSELDMRVQTETLKTLIAVVRSCY